MLFEITANLHFLGFDLQNISDSLDASNEKSARDLFIEKYRRLRVKQLIPALKNTQSSWASEVLKSKPQNAMVLSCQKVHVKNTDDEKQEKDHSPMYDDSTKKGTEKAIKFKMVNHEAVPIGTLRFDKRENDQIMKEYRRLRPPCKPAKYY